jgi:hypothetical protein
MPHAAIDIHAHVLPPGWEDWAARYGVSGRSVHRSTLKANTCPA